MERIRALGPDALVVYDLQDESGRQAEPRPFPFLPTLAPDTYAHELMGELPVPKIVYRSIPGADRVAFERWLLATGSAAAPRFSVLVGAPSGRAPQPAALTLADAYAMARRHAPALVLGAIAIAERHARRADEHERMLAKVAAGCRFFVTQAVYDAGSSKSLLSDYARAARARGQKPAPVVLTFSPCGAPRTLALLKWLGVAVPRWLENELLDARDALGTSVRLAETIAGDLLAFAHDRQIPVGINVESVSVRKEEIEAAAALFKALRTLLGRSDPA
jgi:5,10-methylenetetrahydrofolate reductase